MKIEPFQHTAAIHYMIAALWSSTDNTDDTGGEPLDANYSIDDIAPETATAMRAECSAFIADNWETIRATEQAAEQCGHDFWLTRNGHGAGFWDRGYDVLLGDALTRAAHECGPRDLYVGDDGKVYQA